MWKATAVSLITLVAACGGVAQPEPSLDVGSLPTTLTLKVGQGRTVAGVVVRFAEVKADSRCPTDVTCVWQGNAELALVARPEVGDGPGHPVVLNTGVDPHSADALGLRFTVIKLSPEPVSTIPTQGYQAEIRIERVSAP